MDPLVTRFVRIWVFDGSIFGVTVGLDVADIFCLVLRMCWRIIFRCPLEDGIDFGRCFLMSWEVRPGQVVKKLLSIPLIHVSGVGDHAHM